MQFTANNKVINLDKPIAMGILNITTDSFFDGGNYIQPSIAIAKAIQMAEQGAQIIDVGAESTRPYANVLSLEDELAILTKIIPDIVHTFSNTNIIVSIDTYKPEVMQAMLNIGADMINDVSGFKNIASQKIVAAFNCAVCIMHMQNTPQNMQNQPYYTNIMQDIIYFLLQQAQALIALGIDACRIVLDPGFGFGKTFEHNMLLLKKFNMFSHLGYTCLAGLSRKSFLGTAAQQEQAKNRLSASLGAAMIALQQGAHILRVHDVAETMDIIRLFNSYQNI
jgi:dihydropteroate synthase